MTEIDKVKGSGLIPPRVSEGMVVAQVVVKFSGGLSPNTVKHAGRAALVVASAEMDSRKVHTALKVGGHSTRTAEGEFLKLVPVNSDLVNTLQELPDGTSVHTVDDKEKPELLKEAPKPAIIKADSNVLNRREITRRYIMNVFSTTEDPGKFGLLDLVKNEPEENNVIPFPTPAAEKSKPAA